jgi:hypothetical protein
MMLLTIGLKELDLLLLTLHLPNEVDHIGQLLDLDVLGINVVVQLINEPPQLVRGLPHKVNAHPSDQKGGSVDKGLQTMNFGQELSPNHSGVMRNPLPPIWPSPFLGSNEPYSKR